MDLRWRGRLAVFMTGIAEPQTKKNSMSTRVRRTAPAVRVLELYPSEAQRGVAGRFIAEAREKRRSGAGVLSPDDYWMLESLSLARAE